MTYQKFGKDRHRPDGDWVQTTAVEQVVGIQHRKTAASVYIEAVRKAEKQGLRYGIRLEQQPDNPHDRYAIAVYGFVDREGWLRSGTSEWLVGYLNRDLAADIHRDLISKGIPIAGELYEIFVDDQDYIEIKLIVLAPPGYGHKARVRPETLEEGASPAKEATDHTDEDLGQLKGLILRLWNTPVLTDEECDRLYEAHFSRTFDRMVETGESYGIASGGPDILNQDEATFRSDLRRIDNDLSEQVKIVSEAVESYFQTGEVPAPYYPWRIAIITRKAKLLNTEKAFLAAWCKHFGGIDGGKYGELAERARKAGVYE